MDVKDLYLAQQIVVFFFPIITNLATVNILVVGIRIWYFEKRFRDLGENLRLQSHASLVCMVLIAFQGRLFYRSAEHPRHNPKIPVRIL